MATRHSMQPLAILAVVLAVAGAAALAATMRARGGTPDWLATKVAFETGYAQTQAPQLTRCANEVATLEKRRADAPKDEKGNPILPGEYVPKFETLAPREKVMVVEENTTDYLPSALRDELDITSTAYAPYDVLIAASRKDEKGTALLYRFRSDPNSYGFEELVYRFPGRGPIVLESLAESNSVVTFRWGDGQQGYFDLEAGTATFSPYTGQ